ncbi:hypothetical protein V6N12_013556 [Hibiscus sabdariffa]|uniref:Uncharacterized protein n=1 Tax=Hibiscus sabdariffa TaxID=183260 RepID=A0ABR2CBC6_9ROSI
MANSSSSTDLSASINTAQPADAYVAQFVAAENRERYNKIMKGINIWEEQGFQFSDKVDDVIMTTRLTLFSATFLRPFDQG